MKANFYQKVFTCLSLVFMPNVLFAQGNSLMDNSIEIPAITIKKDKKTGKYSIPNNFAGSAAYITPEEIEERQTIDINRIIRDIPGINIQEEDGNGLRPNIGMRGGRNERSQDITLMEDGILAAPAPYAASSAYYFPSMGRIKGIEVRKGSSAIKYGPRTTSGALNLITTPIPSISSGALKSSIGSFNEKNVNFNYGDSGKNYGYVVNFDHSSSDGFKDLDGGGDTGYNLNDFMGKFRINTDRDADIYQHLEFKLGINNENSHETYAGLTLSDFKDNPYRRYKGTALDEMNAEHEQYEVKHYIEPSDNFNLTTTAYHHKFSRNWYKLDKVNNISLGTIFSDTTAYSSELDILKGGDGTIKLKANNRDYATYGLQSIAKSKINLGKTKHSFEYGVRYHQDDEDRFQHRDEYTFSGGELSLTTPGAAGSAGNKIASASSISTFIEDEIEIGKLTIVPGARVEHIETKSRDYGSSDPGRTSFSKDMNTEDVFVPGIATSYALSDELAIFAGVHKGFAPPSPSTTNASAEESVNYEIGTRFNNEDKFFEGVFFFNDYKNLLGTDTNSGGGNGNGDQYNGGAAQSFGVELAAGYDIKTNLIGKSLKFPLTASYTFNHAEFKSSFTENGIEEWGDVSKGDELPYMPQHQLSISVGMEVQKLALNLSGKYVDKMRSTAGSGSIAKSDKIPSHIVVDFAAFYELQKDKKVFLAVDNIFDRDYAASLRPAGLRPGKPMAAKIGMIIGF